MEGPTPISALIHAATMVTAGIFMVARMSPLFELSDTALSFVTIIGATTALFMAFLGIVQNDIKRVVAYSTLSQLGYMTVALGVSAYSAAIFHLMTHAFFKALLFLGAGSVIIALHHEQDLRRMGGLRKYMPITYWTAVVGSLALAGIPPFAGFFSKDAIIEAVHFSDVYGHGYAYFAVTAGVFVTAFYSFRMLFLAFHGGERFDTEGHGHDAAHGADEHAHDAAAAGAQPDAHDDARRTAAGEPVGRDGAAGPARDPVGVRGLGVHRADADRELLRQLDRRACRASGDRRNSGRSGTASARSSSTASCRCPSGSRSPGSSRRGTAT